MNLIHPGDLLVLNNTKVIPARVFGTKDTGGRVEILVEQIDTSTQTCLAFIRASKTPKPNSLIEITPDNSFTVLARDGERFKLQFVGDQTLHEFLDHVGHMPLPPYIDRDDEPTDRDRYQTVFAKEPGAVAAPTASLHFDAETLNQLVAAGVRIGYVTLHVGSGTFQPIRHSDVNNHVMHAEHCEVPEATANLINEVRQRKGRIIAVGTTAVRSLETAGTSGVATPYRGETRLFITPGYRFRSVDAMITNFHQPETTLLALVCAFAGYERTMSAYRHAVSACYRFFSYGDAMYIDGENT